MTAPSIALPADVLLGETLLIPSHVQCEALGRPFNLTASFYRPFGIERPPLIIFNHGSTGPGAIPPRLVQTFDIQARFFLARGFAFLAPMRRGRGASEGDYVEGYDRDPLKLAGGLRHALDDLDAVVSYMRRREDVDGGRILVAGQSRGGILSIAYAGQQPHGVVGGINFSGGWIAECGMIEDFNREVFARAGGSAVAPTLWLYAENDSILDPAAIRRWHDSFTGAGGEAQLYLFAPLDNGDGHHLFDHPAVWRSAVDAFLHQLGFSW
jgi:Dienelactone hydrolase and related enzymes